MLNRLARNSSSTLVKKLVPFSAVAVGNMINLPYIRRDELIDGITLYDENQNEVGKSRKMGRESIAKVVASRILMATTSMVRQ